MKYKLESFILFLGLFSAGMFWVVAIVWIIRHFQ